MATCEYCGNSIEYATATCMECGECMLCWPYECSCIIIEPYDDLENEDCFEEEPGEEFGEDNYLWLTQFWQR